MPKYQKTVTAQNVLQPSRQKYSKTFGRNHLWLSRGPPRPSRAGGAAEPGTAHAGRSSLRAPRATSLQAAVPARRRGARSLAHSPLALPSLLLSLFASARLLRLHGCRTHRAPE